MIPGAVQKLPPSSAGLLASVFDSLTPNEALPTPPGIVA